MAAAIAIICVALAQACANHPSTPVRQGTLADDRSQDRFVRVGDLPDLVTPERSNLKAYHLTGAVWVPDRPVLINRDFDFATAMALPDVGPAIAAGSRIEKNKDTAGLLANMPEVDLAASLEQALRGQPSLARLELKTRAPSRLAIFGLLYGSDRAALLTILEVYSTNTESCAGGCQETRLAPLRYIHISLPHSLDEWARGHGALLASELRAGVVRVATMLSAARGGACEGDRYRCVVGDGELLTGRRLSGDHDGYLLTSDMIPDTVLSCSAAQIASSLDNVPEQQPAP